jgi:hypothetical protein
MSQATRPIETGTASCGKALSGSREALPGGEQRLLAPMSYAVMAQHEAPSEAIPYPQVGWGGGRWGRAWYGPGIRA